MCQPVAAAIEGPEIGVVASAAPLGQGLDEVAFAEHTQMLHDRPAAETGHTRDELPGAQAGSLGEALEKAAPGRVGKGAVNAIGGFFFASHQGDHTVTCQGRVGRRAA
jgi:hypothetical protein